MDKSILQITGLNKSYGGIKVLSDVNFDLIPGEVHGLVGENGAGKTTLIKIIAGMEKPDGGTKLTFEDKPLENLTPQKSIQLGISVIYQDISLFPNLSIAENICAGDFKSRIINWDRIHKTAREALDKVGCEDINLNTKLGNVGIGKQQLVALARAVLFKSKIVIMDEPSATLSASEVQILYRTIRMLKEDNVSVIYISHKLDEVLTVADRITILRDGEVIATKPANELDNQSLIGMMVGRKLRFSSMRNEGEKGEKIFEVKKLTKEPLFRDISFSLHRNEILGITGLVGARRSEVARTIFGLSRADGGVIILDGKEITVRSTADAISRGICYLPEDRREEGLFLKQSMTWNITAVKLNKILGKYKLISTARELSLAKHFIDRLNIRPGIPGMQTEHISGGNQQKILFGRWLNADPRLLIADEPTSGVDVGAKSEVHRLLRELASSGVGVILISSDLPEVLAISDRILIMRNGRIVDEINSVDATQEDVIEKGLMG